MDARSTEERWRSRAAFVAAAGAFLSAALLGWYLGESYVGRLSHRQGYELIAVDDQVIVPISKRPRHAVLVMIDGLRLDAAKKTEFARRFFENGRCFDTAVGLPSISGPVYAVVSTGLEQDRTGVRNNDDPAPVAAESIWAVAHQAGLWVVGRSELNWWQEMFGHAFDRYTETGESVDALAIAPGELGDLTLIHPVYVDTAGHDYGARSPEYAAAVSRADAGVLRLFDALDLRQDLLVVGADHGHSPSGGHGGRAPEITHVLTCYAGRGIAPSTSPSMEIAPLDARVIGPSLAVLLGLRFPRHMRASEDGLDAISTMVQTSTLGQDYVADRMRAIERFRAVNRRALGRRLGRREGSWGDWYARARSDQAARAIPVMLGFALALAWALRKRGFAARSSVGLFAWIFAVLFGTWAAHTLLLGSFDFTCINKRLPYIERESIACIGVAVPAVLFHRWFWRDPARAIADQGAIVWIALGAEAAHIAAFGWPLSFPLPGAVMFFLPFIISIFTVIHALIGFVLAAYGAAFDRTDGG